MLPAPAAACSCCVLLPAGAVHRDAQALLVVALHKQPAAAALAQPLRRAQHQLCNNGITARAGRRACMTSAARARWPARWPAQCGTGRRTPAAHTRPATHECTNAHAPSDQCAAPLTCEGSAQALQARHGRQEGALELLRPAASAQGGELLRAGHGDPAPQVTRCRVQCEEWGRRGAQCASRQEHAPPHRPPALRTCWGPPQWRPGRHGLSACWPPACCCCCRAGGEFHAGERAATTALLSGASKCVVLQVRLVHCAIWLFYRRPGIAGRYTRVYFWAPACSTNPLPANIVCIEARPQTAYIAAVQGLLSERPLHTTSASPRQWCIVPRRALQS